VSTDLYNWTVCGEEVNDRNHEGANVFEFGGSKWMITDEWNGLAVYKTEDFTNWNKVGAILREGGTRECDGTKGHHADVLVRGENAYIIYFTHPFEDYRTCIQAAKLRIDGETLICDRNEVFDFVL